MLKRSLFIFAALASLLIMSLSVGVAQEEAETIKLGAVVPLTGRFAGGGAQVERGYQYGVEAINEAGGVTIDGEQYMLELVLLDDESDPVKTVSNFEDLFTEEDVTVYLGGFGSDLHAAAAAVAEVNQVPYLGVAFAVQDPHNYGFQYLFSPFPKSPALSTTMFEFVDETVENASGELQVGILWENTDWGEELRLLWEADAEAFGYEVVFNESYTPGSSDFTDLILGMQDADVDLMLSLPSPPDGITLFTNMAELGWTPDHALVIRAPDPPTWSGNLGTVGDYVTFMPGWHNALAFEASEETLAAVNERHIEELGRPADPIVGPSYALVEIVADALERAGSTDRDAVRDAISATDMDTIIGPVTFNEDGTGNVVTAILQVQNGRPELVWPAEFATADFVFPAPAFDDRDMMEEEEESDD